MSMSQEEIESLMTGLDIADDDSSEEEAPVAEESTLNTDEIEELIAQTEEVDVNKIDESKEKEEVSSPETKQEENISSEVKEETDTSKLEEVLESSESVNNDDIDELLKDIESEDLVVSQDTSTDEKLEIEEDKKESEEDKVESKINEGIFPLPAERDTKVVTQLTEVANDSEEKVSQIFDVLSLTLDNNSTTRNVVSNIENFMSSQTKLLESLNKKFPNIEVFKNSLDDSSKIIEDLTSLKNSLNDEDNQIFQAMELMQFNDINRQKIERVMAVIRKLSLYLNNLFEDDGQRDIAVAKHIHGDHSDDLIGDDLDKLIDEFNNN